MREIKFRCWYNNQMNKVQDISFRHKTINLFGADIIKFEDGILMQYTGLKDKNGVEIYEGDIIDISYDEAIIKNAVIEYHGASFYACTNNDMWELDNYFDIEVIGNIYEYLKENGE